MTWLAWLAPALFGIGCWSLACGWPRRPAAYCAALGGGWLLGALATGVALWALAPWVAPRASVHLIGPWFAVLGVAALAAAWRWRRRPAPAVEPLAWPWRVLVAVLVALLALRWVWIWHAATLPPLFPWDAWSSWSAKPATWFGLDRWVDFVRYPRWLASADPNLFTSEAAGYPEWLGRLEVWYAAGAGCWCDPAYTRLWPVAWAALLLLGYGQLRALGAGVVLAAVATYALGSLPLVDVHAALAGYADLWLAAFLGAGVVAWLIGHHERQIGPRLLGLAFIVGLPAVKLEGGVWMLLALAMMALSLVPRPRRRLALAAVAALIALVAVVLFGFGRTIPAPGPGGVFVGAGGLHIPGMQPLALGWHPIAESALASLFSVLNWHLLFYVAVVVGALRCWRAGEVCGLLGSFLLGALAFLVVLFFFTRAAEWATDFTSIGRIVLQIVPLVVAWIALLLKPPSVTTTPPQGDAQTSA